MKTSSIKSLAAALVLSCASVGPAAALGLLQAPAHLKDQGAGLHTGPSTVNQVATFNLTPNMVSCGVGTLDALGVAGPFEMLMYSLNVSRYTVDRTNGVITATGTMRSATRIGGLVVEDTNGAGLNPAPHDFVAFGFDNGAAGDRFELHFKTPLWNTSNPLCTPSSVIAGGCMFGHEIFMGEISVEPQQ